METNELNCILSWCHNHIEKIIISSDFKRHYFVYNSQMKYIQRTKSAAKKSQISIKSLILSVSNVGFIILKL